jgi:hypothetical protein
MVRPVERNSFDRRRLQNLIDMLIAMLQPANAKCIPDGEAQALGLAEPAPKPAR